MRWDELDLTGGVWTIARTKSGDSHEASLAKPLVALLKARRPEDTDANPWVFSADSKSGHIVSYRKAWVRACAAAGISGLRVHDLRRTLSSWAAEAKVNVAVVQAQLGHLDPQTTLKHYTSIAGPERKRAVESTVAAMLKAAVHH
jgi:integrase